MCLTNCAETTIQYGIRRNVAGGSLILMLHGLLASDGCFVPGDAGGPDPGRATTGEALSTATICAAQVEGSHSASKVLLSAPPLGWQPRPSSRRRRSLEGFVEYEEWSTRACPA